MAQVEDSTCRQQQLQEPNRKLLYGVLPAPPRDMKFPIGMDIPIMDGSGFTHLGAPMGDEAFTAKIITVNRESRQS